MQLDQEHKASVILKYESATRAYRRSSTKKRVVYARDMRWIRHIRIGSIKCGRRLGAV